MCLIVPLGKTLVCSGTQHCRGLALVQHENMEEPEQAFGMCFALGRVGQGGKEEGKFGLNQIQTRFFRKDAVFARCEGKDLCSQLHPTQSPLTEQVVSLCTQDQFSTGDTLSHTLSLSSQPRFPGADPFLA